MLHKYHGRLTFHSFWIMNELKLICEGGKGGVCVTNERARVTLKIIEKLLISMPLTRVDLQFFFRPFSVFCTSYTATIILQIQVKLRMSERNVSCFFGGVFMEVAWWRRRDGGLEKERKTSIIQINYSTWHKMLPLRKITRKYLNVRSARFCW